MSRRRTLAISTLPLVLLTGVSACAEAPQPATDRSAATTNATFTPVTIDNCGEKITVTSPPQRLVTLNQGATEVALALGLDDRMAGTAYLDDTVSSRYEQAYAAVPVIAREYPTVETFLAAKPDFAYAAYSSAFADRAVGTREELSGRGIGSYLSPFGCPKGTAKADPTFDSAWAEISDVGSIFGVSDRAEQVVREQKAVLESVTSQSAGKGLKVLWYDSGDKTPFVGGGRGGPQLVIDAVGATNIFASLDGSWGDGSWENAVAANPDVIVLADASWDTAEQKKAYLRNDPVLKKLKAVQNNAFVTVPFSESTPGVRLVEGASDVSKQIAELGLK